MVSNVIDVLGSAIRDFSDLTQTVQGVIDYDAAWQRARDQTTIGVAEKVPVVTL